MKRELLELYHTRADTYRATIKTAHSRLIYIELKIKKSICNILDYCYIDRSGSGNYYPVPKKLITKQCNYSDLLSVIAEELDRVYYGIEIINSYSELSREEFIKYKLSGYRRGYKFLIFIGTGRMIDGIPEILKTRLKNRTHRSIYLEMHYCGDNRGVVFDCHYCDRVYKSKDKVMPETFTSVFFEYSRKNILNMVNNELNTAFTDIIFVTDNSIDIDSKYPLCGNI